MAFYLVEKRRCPCGKVATHEIRASGTDHRGDFCLSCAKRKVREWTKEYTPTVNEKRGPVVR